MAEAITKWNRRVPAGTALVVFVHGFTGEAENTWVGFPNLLANDPDISAFDVCFWGYPSTLSLITLLTRLVWSDNPDLSTLGGALRTLLDNAAGQYEKIILVGHSMGGLIIQLFILEELKREQLVCGRSVNLDRLTEVVLYGTPSDGLIKASLASLLNTQAADMSWFGDLIMNLRYQWKRLIDDRRVQAPPTFRLTLVAGIEDKFVPQESSLGPFPFDEKELVPGNHTRMVKPQSSEDLKYLVLKNRLLRRTLTRGERDLIEGVGPDLVARMNRVSAAASLGDVDALIEQATELLTAPCVMPKVERALGFALLDVEAYDQSARLLQRYITFQKPDDKSLPFRDDGEAIQQLAIAQSGAGDIIGAVTSLTALDSRLRSDPETLGILAGRFKRQWLKTETNVPVARKALDLYKQALGKAKDQARPDQIFYNGVNAAYLQFALGDAEYQDLAREIQHVCESVKADYWSEATRAECLLLQRQFTEALIAYRSAARLVGAPRHWSSTGQQALDILSRLGNPEEAGAISGLFHGVRGDSANR